MTSSEAKTLTLTPIGYIRTGKTMKFDAPHQPDHSKTEESVVELIPGQGFEYALRDLESFSHIWLVWWFDRNSTWRPMVRPPRGNSRRRGVFSTRSPHRPNPIGMTAVRLLGISGLTLKIGSHDLVDGTPIFDIKPYLITADLFPEASLGWLAEIEAENNGPAEYALNLSSRAQTQLEWLRARDVDFYTRAFELLTRDPRPHRTRRIVKFNQGFRMGCGAWRIFFVVTDKTVQIERFAPGYPERLLRSEGHDRVPNRDEQLEFLQKWPDC